MSMEWKTVLWAGACGAVLLGSTPAVADSSAGETARGASVLDATSDQVADAQSAFQAADERFDVQDYEGALAKFRESYAIVASPNSRLMIARCLRELGRLDEAYVEYEATLNAAEALAEDQDSYTSTAQAARDELEALRSRVAWLTIELGDVPETAEITVAGRPVRHGALGEPLAVVPGQIDVVARLSDGRFAQGQVHVAAGRESTLTLKLGETVTVGSPPPPQNTPASPEPSPPAAAPPAAGPPPAAEPPPRQSNRMPLVLATAGVGVAGFVGFAVFGSQSRSRFDDLEASCPDHRCPTDLEDDIDSGKRAQLLANVSLGVGVAGLGVSAVLLATKRRAPREKSVSLWVSPTGVGIEGGFQ